MGILRELAVEAAVSAVILLPIFGGLDCWVFRRRTPAYFLFALYLCVAFSMVGLPSTAYVRFEPHFQWIPFADLISDLRNEALNVLLFVPLGAMLPMLWQEFRKAGKVILFGLCLSLIIESLQIFSGRATDVNDLITNTLGAALGYPAGIFLLRFLPIHPGKPKDLTILLGTVFAVMLFLQPLLANAVWLAIL